MTSAPPFAVCHQVTVEEREAIRRSIDRDELVRRILQLCNIPSPMRGERAAGEYVHAWMREEGFDPRKVGLVEDRFNVVGRYGGHGDGPSLAVHQPPGYRKSLLFGRGPAHLPTRWRGEA